MSISQIEYLKNSVSKAQIISFDLFDTLLVRPYCSPQDVFRHLEFCFNKKGFTESRIEAENRASIILNKKYVNYDEIYKYMPKQFTDLKEKEKKLELQTIYINADIKIIFEYALKLNKKIIFTTDMYHSREFIVEILKKNGIVGYEKIYISGYIEKSKHYGDIYGYIANDLKVKTQEILHIGDNIFADFENAKKSGCRAIYNEAPLIEFLKTYPKFQSFYENNKTLTASIILGLLIKKWLLNNKRIENYWEYFGYFYAGALCYGLSKFVYDEAIKDDLKEMIFVARDGYIIEKIFNLLQNQYNTTIKTFYIYANRAIYTLINFDTNTHNNKKSKKSDLIIEHFKNQIKELENIKNKSENKKRKWILKHIHLFDHFKEENKTIYKQYIDSFDLKEKNIGVFDLATQNFYTMKLFKDILENKIFFMFCLSVFGNKYDKEFLYKTYAGKDYFCNYNLLEFMITAPELPVKIINTYGHPERIKNQFEQKRMQVYEKISESEYEFSRDLLATFGEFNVDFKIKPLIALINLFIEKLDEEDFNYFSEIYHGTDEGHTNYIPLLDSIDTRISSQQNLSNQGAVTRIKSYLSYQLGNALIQAKNPFKALMLPLTLAYIFLRYKISKTLFNCLIKSNPSLKPLNLNQYSDYNEALQVKKHLSYRLGNALIKNPLTFVFKIKRIYREWKEEKNGE